MHYNVTNNYGEDSFPDVYVCAKTGTSRGGERPGAQRHLCRVHHGRGLPSAFVVMVENGGYGRSVCIPILSQVLSACMEDMNPG